MTNIQADRCQTLLKMMESLVRKVVIITHTNPDGDALGSSLGLNCVLQNAGYQSFVLLPSDFPILVKDLDVYQNHLVYEHNEKEAELILLEADLLFFLDFNDIKRVGKLKKTLEKLSKPVVLIDHHPQPTIESPYIFSDTTVSSTAELVYDFIKKMGWGYNMDALGADALLTGIIADTASFSHNARRKELYKVVAELIEKGADQNQVYETLFNTNTEDRLRLLGYALSEKMEIFPQYHAAVIVLTKEELKSFNFKIGDTEGFVNYPLTIKGIVFSSFFMENEDKIKISFRSKGSFAVNELSAKHFSGGGHKNASGGESKHSLNETVEKLIRLFPEYAKELEEESHRQ
jgi:phosphoesterase RecJ-like protein